MDKTPLQLEQDLYRLCKEANKAEEDAVTKKETFEILKDAKEALLERIASSQSGKYWTDKERAARATDEWKEFFAGFQAARRDAAEASMRKSTANRNWETCRSLLSSKRIERTTGV